MLGHLATEVQAIFIVIKHHLFFALVFAGILGIVYAINVISHSRFNTFGIHPRKPKGLLCIPVSFMIHSNMNYLLFNIIPLVILTAMLVSSGETLFYKTTILLVVISGMVLWIFGKRSSYLGTGALVAGYIGYLLARTHWHLNGITIVLAMVCIYYICGIFTAIFPSIRKHIYVEELLVGFLTGIGVAWF